MTKTFRIAAIAGAFAALPFSAAFADRAPNSEEQMILAEALEFQGFTSWGKVEWDDDGVWEVDDAVTSQGERRDIKLDRNFNVVSNQIVD